jgi:hypothetical protein
MINYVHSRRGVHLELKRDAGAPGWTEKSWLSSLTLLEQTGEVGVVAENANIRQELLGTAAPTHQLESVANVKQFEADLREVARGRSELQRNKVL